jgi:hypothetical protein
MAAAATNRDPVSASSCAAGTALLTLIPGGRASSIASF